MPFSELQRIARGNLESSTQTKMSSNCSTDLVFPTENEFMELVCQNGQILTQAQSGRNRKNLSCFSSFSSRPEEKDGDETVPKCTRFGNMDAGLNDLRTAPGPSGHTGLGQDEDTTWLNYSLDETLQHDYCSEFFSELTGVNLNALSVPIDKNSSYSQMVRDAPIVSVQIDANPEQRNATKVSEADPETSRPSSQLCHSQSKDGQSSLPSLRPNVSDFSSCNANNNNTNNNTNNTNNHQASFRNSSQTPGVSMANTKMQKHDPGPSRLPPNSTGLINFSHFSRPLAKANLQNINVGASPGSSVDRLRSNEKISSATSNPVESILIDLTSCSRSVTASQSQPVSMPGKVDIKSFMGKPPKELPSAEQSGALCREDATRVARLPDKIHRHNSNVASSTTVRKLDTEKGAEPVVASSSICSGNSAGAASNDPKHILKRKSRETEETEYHSEDVEEESVGVRKPASARGGMGAKRSRAAEVHNLSERRRRDRINEKMRALQELIPNCNKVDKASMLDEAIEYLKSLQVQVQIMSMGTGLYMPPMMLPTGMQRMHPQHLPHFSPMGVGMGMGMGMGMGYGMGMLDMSNGSSASPMMQFPMNGVPYPCPPLPGPSNFPTVAGSNLQMFGLPGQGLPMSMPRAPYAPPSEGPSTKSVTVPDVPGTATPDVPDSAPSSSSKDPKQNVNTQMMHKTIAECSQNQTPQGQALREGFEQSSMVQRNAQSLQIGGNGNISSSNGMGLGTSRATGYN